MLDTRELVVEGVGRRDAERAGGELQLVRGVRQGHVEPAAFCEAAERREPPGHRARFPEHAPAAVWWPDDLMRDPVQAEQFDRLREVARRDLDLVPALAQQRDQRPEERHLRRVGDVDPDAHAATLPERLLPADNSYYFM